MHWRCHQSHQLFASLVRHQHIFTKVFHQKIYTRVCHKEKILAPCVMPVLAWALSMVMSMSMIRIMTLFWGLSKDGLCHVFCTFLQKTLKYIDYGHERTSLKKWMVLQTFGWPDWMSFKMVSLDHSSLKEISWMVSFFLVGCTYQFTTARA